ncbi:MAG: hypothetical protein R3C05_00705 [Pirellulaceae bacterium]
MQRCNNGSFAPTHMLVLSLAIESRDRWRRQLPLARRRRQRFGANDQRGVPFVRRAGPVDIGAFERQILADSFFVVTTHVDELDYSNNGGATPQVQPARSDRYGERQPRCRNDHALPFRDTTHLLQLGQLEITDSV